MRLSLDTDVSFWTKYEVAAFENPTPPGDYKYKTFAFLFHRYGFKTIVVGSSFLNVNGPFYEKKPISEEQAGPPLSHRINGSVNGLF